MDKIGEKIKSLRVSKRMTQSELAGDQITRNMLSLIENGSALPSLQTIMYLSERLGVPAGILLARESEELLYKKMGELPKIKSRYKAGEYKLCAAMCEAIVGEECDDEIEHILSMCHFNIAKEAFNAGKLHESRVEFDLACMHSENTLYSSSYIRSAVSVYFEYMLRLSPTLVSDMGYDTFDGQYVLSDPFCRYARALGSIENGDVASAEAYLTNEAREGCYSLHVKALVDMSRGNYAEAKEKLRSVMNSDDPDCRVIMYDVFKNLEECCRETDDYKGAYEYSVGKVELLEHMLAYTDI